MAESFEVKPAAGVLLFLWFAVLVAAGVAFAVTDSSLGSRTVGAAIAVVFAVRLTAMKCVADTSGLFVRNAFRTRHLRWDEVATFTIGPVHGLGIEGVHTVLRNGQDIAIDTTARRPSSQRPWMEQQAQRLREWLPE